MEENNTLNILKQAILLELRGKAFYENIAEKSDNSAVQKIFRMLADEEQEHIKTLSDQFKIYKKEKKFAAGSVLKKDTGSVVSSVLTKEIKEKISAAGFEAAAIGAGIAMEERAISFYSENAEMTSDPEAKALYKWLSDWERDHLNMLLDIDKDLREKIWFDNQFWPL